MYDQAVSSDKMNFLRIIFTFYSLPTVTKMTTNIHIWLRCIQCQRIRLIGFTFFVFYVRVNGCECEELKINRLENKNDKLTTTKKK